MDTPVRVSLADLALYQLDLQSSTSGRSLRPIVVGPGRKEPALPGFGGNRPVLLTNKGQGN